MHAGVYPEHSLDLKDIEGLTAISVWVNWQRRL
jgi:hypothetical protein